MKNRSRSAAKGKKLPCVERLFVGGTFVAVPHRAARGRENRHRARIRRASAPAFELCSPPMRELFDRAESRRRRLERRRSARQPLVLAMLVGAGALACGEEVLVGRWVLRSSPADAGVEADASASDNPQSVNAERARQDERDRDNPKPGSHDADKRH